MLITHQNGCEMYMKMLDDLLLYSLQLEKNRVEQLEKFYPNLICTQSLGHVSTICLVYFQQLFISVYYSVIQAFPSKEV